MLPVDCKAFLRKVPLISQVISRIPENIRECMGGAFWNTEIIPLHKNTHPSNRGVMVIYIFSEVVALHEPRLLLVTPSGDTQRPHSAVSLIPL